jgi:site-specific DNA-adenine methylase
MNTGAAEMKITAMAPWFGGNRTLAAHVGTALKGCRWVGVPFAGGMSELRHIAAPTIVVGDLHRHVINLARVLQDDIAGPKLYRQLRRLPFCEDVLDESQAWCKAFKGRPEVDGFDCDAAYHYFVACWMGRSGKSGTDDEFNGGCAVRWNANGGDSNTRYRSAVRSIVGWRRVLARCNLVVLDCFEFLNQCQDQAAHGIYCDPPFPEAGAKYKHKFTEADHQRLGGRLVQFEKAVVVCRFYDHPLIRELYPETCWRWTHHTGRKQSNADAPEVLLKLRNREESAGLFT